MAEWLCSGLQSRLRRFDSDPRLHKYGFFARVVKLVDTRDLKSLGHCVRAGSIPAPGTNKSMTCEINFTSICSEKIQLLHNYANLPQQISLRTNQEIELKPSLS